MNHPRNERNSPALNTIELATEEMRATRGARYCVCLYSHPHEPDREYLMAVGGRVIVWDTLQYLRDHCAPYFGGGRRFAWNEARDVICFTPLTRQRDNFNKLTIVSAYDPYHVAANFGGVLSEAHGLDWKHHYLFHEVANVLLDWIDLLEAQRQHREEVFLDERLLFAS